MRQEKEQAKEENHKKESKGDIGGRKTNPQFEHIFFKTDFVERRVGQS